MDSNFLRSRSDLFKNASIQQNIATSRSPKPIKLLYKQDNSYILKNKKMIISYSQLPAIAKVVLQNDINEVVRAKSISRAIQAYKVPKLEPLSKIRASQSLPRMRVVKEMQWNEDITLLQGQHMTPGKRKIQIRPLRLPKLPERSKISIHRKSKHSRSTEQLKIQKSTRRRIILNRSETKRSVNILPSRGPLDLKPWENIDDSRPISVIKIQKY